MVKTATHYDTLGVSRNAPAEVIRGAYKALAQKNHPDKNLDNPDATNIMQMINQAYDVLSDPDKRANYDARLEQQEMQAPQQQQYQSQNSHSTAGYSSPKAPPQETKGVRHPFLPFVLGGALIIVALIYMAYTPVSVQTSLPAAVAAHAAQPAHRPDFVPKETSAQELATCIFAAAKTYDVSPQLLLSLLSAEGGVVGEKKIAPGLSYDLGLMHINSFWIIQLAGAWSVSTETALRMVRDDACINVGVAAWILHATVEKDGDLQNEISLYYAAVHHLKGKIDNRDYVAKVIKLTALYKTVHSPADLAGNPAAKK